MKNRSVKCGAENASSTRSLRDRDSGQKKDNDIARNVFSNDIRNDPVTSHTKHQLKTRTSSNTRNSESSVSQERRGSRGIIKPSVGRAVIVQGDDHFNISSASS